MNRIAVIGCGGSGKTTLSNQIGAKLGLPVLHVDGFYWRDVPGSGRVELSPYEWPDMHRSLIAQPRWVIDGMKLGVLAERLAAAETVVFLDLSTWSCLRGVLGRRLRAARSTRPDLGTYDVGLNGPFLRWIWTFRAVQRPRVLALLASCTCEVVVLRRRRDVQRYVASLEPPRAELLAA